MALPVNAELLRGKKLSFEEIKELVIKNGFGAESFAHEGNFCLLSRGVHYALLCNAIALSEVETALQRFLNGDWGMFYEHPEDSIFPGFGFEYGQYESSYGSEPGNGAIMIHREPFAGVVGNSCIVVYFQFER